MKNPLLFRCQWVKGQGQEAIARESLNEFEPKLSQILIILGKRTDCVFKVIGSKFKIDFA